MKAESAVICFLAVTALCAQTPAFEVASVRQSNPDEPGGRIRYLPGARFSAAACRLPYLIERLFGVRGFQVVNLPKWISEIDSRFTIQAKAAQSVSDDQLRIMAQNLLVDRFRLRFHRETRDINIYALVVGKNGPKLRVAKDDGNPRGSGSIQAVTPMGWFRGTNVSLSLLAEALSGRLDRPIVDATHFAEPVDFDLQWAPDQSADDTHPSFVTAVQEQLGLRFEPQKLPLEVLVIDHLERPSEN